MQDLGCVQLSRFLGFCFFCLFSVFADCKLFVCILICCAGYSLDKQSPACGWCFQFGQVCGFSCLEILLQVRTQVKPANIQIATCYHNVQYNRKVLTESIPARQKDILWILITHCYSKGISSSGSQVKLHKGARWKVNGSVNQMGWKGPLVIMNSLSIIHGNLSFMLWDIFSWDWPLKKPNRISFKCPNNIHLCWSSVLKFCRN